MKKYPELNETNRMKRDAMQQQLDELILFQSLQSESEGMHELYHGNAQAIAYGLQPWIDALEKSLKRSC